VSPPDADADAAPPPLPTLQGARCRLRPLRPADAPALARHANDEAVRRNLFEGFPSPYTLAHAQAWCAAQSGEAAWGRVWGIEFDGEIVGCIGLRPDAGWLRCNAEVGYWVGQAVWRRGIASDALRLVTDWALAALPELWRIYAPIFAWNEGSQAVARRCGYRLEARLERSAIKDGRVIDRVQYVRLRPQE